MSDDDRALVKELRTAEAPPDVILLDLAADAIERLTAERDDLLCQRSGRADAMIDESQHNAQLEGLAIGLEQRGEVSAAHVIRLALKRLDRCHER